MLDVVLCAEEWLRCYDYQPKWSDGVVMAKYDDGGGDHLFAFFQGEEAVVKGFTHESLVSPYADGEFRVWPGIYAGIPDALNGILDDVAVERDVVTFCIWYTSGIWRRGTVTFPKGEDDGSADLLRALHWDSESYCGWACEYYERDLDGDLVAAVYRGVPLCHDLITKLNPDRDVEQAIAELSLMGDV